MNAGFLQYIKPTIGRRITYTDIRRRDSRETRPA